jgi:hypothetical protein
MINHPLSLQESLIKISRSIILTALWILNLIAGGLTFAQQSPEPPKGIMAGQAVNPAKSDEPGLLFYLSGESDFKADFSASGQSLPNYLNYISIIPDGINGPAFSAEDNQLMSYWAPGNIYAQRGTLSFFWRTRYPAGPTPFPVFRVGYADHSSWDMVWLRIDYNGSGFDAFVTDIGLARTRVSYYMDEFPKPDEWTHIALSWDETEGVKFYINGKIVTNQTASGSVYDAGLDQFGPHSRIISPYQVQSRYNFMRGGDFDEVRIYDQMLSDDNISSLSKGGDAGFIQPLKRDLSDRRWRDEWWLRNGWNLPNSPPPILPSTETSIRKVEIQDAIDIKRWYWKANDGIRETTWPGVYNMSRLPGRYDYFVLPDWDCYSGSGQSVKFTLPDEPWNHVEIWGKAWGQITCETSNAPDYTFSVRTKNQIKSYQKLSAARCGGKIRFDNAIIEEPIGSLDVYYVKEGRAPQGYLNENFILSNTSYDVTNKSLNDLSSFIRGRYPSDEQTIMVGITERNSKNVVKDSTSSSLYPFINIMIPYSYNPDIGLDGIEVQLPALNVTPTHNGVYPVNIRIKDPLWQMRDLADFSFSLKPGEAQTLWIDTRDRILPKERALYITIAGAGADLTPDILAGTRINLINKKKESARTEHEQDRFNQIRDLYAHIVEEHPRTSRLNLFNRFIADCDDLLDLNPGHWLASTYRYALTGENKPDYEISKCPEGIPEWAFLQIEYLKHLEHLIMYYIDNRQIDNGEFGGGLSDDGDFTNMFPGIAFLGIDHKKILNSLLLHMKAYYDQDRSAYTASLRQRSLPLFTNGLATIHTDELHAYEEGIQVVGQLQLLDFGNPLHIERGMEIALRVLNDITQINPSGHRLIRSRYYSGTSMSIEDPWQWSDPNSYHVLHTAYMIALYNGNPMLRQMFTELADALLMHFHNGNLYSEINFITGEDNAAKDTRTWQVFYAAYTFTGDKKYLLPIENRITDTKKFDPERLVKSYSEEIRNLGINEYINTLGSTWIDRISSFNPAIQEDRLGGVALTRINNIFPKNSVSWIFKEPFSYESVAIYLPRADSTHVSVIAYNMESDPVSSKMTLWDNEPGIWRVRQGIDTDNDQKMDIEISELLLELERNDVLDLKFAPHGYNIVELELVKKSETGYFKRPDLGIGPDDIKMEGNSVVVIVHSLGAVETPPSKIEMRDETGRRIAESAIPALEAPLDLIPRRTYIKINIPEGININHGSLHIDPENRIKEITVCNNVVKW